MDNKWNNINKTKETLNSDCGGGEKEGELRVCKRWKGS
jgi:hypothetical protein